MNQTDDEILTLDEVAVYLKAGKKTVYSLFQYPRLEHLSRTHAHGQEQG
ncbi:MAG: hypothetical protein IPG40_10085 [Zoogloea sp.]|nr:hypothetical protein [Zoogloea sp.]MBK6654212.1 hypothetical protein [Zoogloea sp.]